MIAVDTNVVLRRLLNDDAAQAEKARRLFESEESVLITDVVLAEAVWTASGIRIADLADALVANKAKVTAQHRDEQYRGTCTYDQAALALDGTKAP